METTKPKPKFSDYLNVLYKWKRFLIINMIVIVTLATLYSYLIPEQFKATSIVMLPAESKIGLGGIGGLLSGSGGLGSLGSQFLGMSGPSQDIIMGILASRTLQTDVIHKYNLMEYYGVDDKNLDKVLKKFSGDFIYEPTQNGMIEVSIINEDPKLSAEMANYIVTIADSINISLNIEQARNNRIFIEKRFEKNITDLKAAEDSFYVFQKKYGIFAVPEQLEVSVQTAAELEAMYVQNDIKAEILKREYGESSPIYEKAQDQAEYIKKRIEELKDESKLSYPSNVLYPFSKIPEMTINYYRAYRDVEIQTKILEFVLPLYEQAKVDEQKSIPTLVVVDKAVPPQLKDSPKKAFIILAAFFLGFFIHLLFVLRGESAIILEIKTNEIEEKEAKFFNSVKSFYRIKK
jgi:uncharacterized protein involved in exopolysaccharide biosynthesis